MCWCLSQRNAELGEGVNKDNLQIGKNWEWISDWALDTNRAVDENGWQYTVDAEDGPWGPVERNIHITRRRRWVRTRRRIGDPKKDEKEVSTAFTHSILTSLHWALHITNLSGHW